MEVDKTYIKKDDQILSLLKSQGIIFNEITEDSQLFDLIGDNNLESFITLRNTKKNLSDLKSGKINIKDEDLNYFKELLLGVLNLFIFRSTFNNKKYDYNPFIEQMEKIKSTQEFKNFMIDNFFNNNILGNEIVNIILNNKKLFKNIEDRDIFLFNMSFVIKNSNDNLTLVIFIPNLKDSNQISINISRLIVSTIFKLIIKKLSFDEIIIIHSKTFYQDAFLAFKEIQKNFFLQFFPDFEILSPVVENFLSPRITVLDQEQEKNFFKENIYLSRERMRKINSKDPLLRYYGIKSNCLIKIERPEIIFDNTGVDICFSYIW